MHITHWVPSTGERPAWPCIMSWLDLNLPDDAKKKFIRGTLGDVEVTWNKVIKDFLASKSDWLFSTHLDVVFDSDTLLRLMSWDKPLISALVFMRHSPVVPHIWKAYEGNEGYYTHRIDDTRKWFLSHLDWIRFGPFIIEPRPEDALVEVDFTSTSCTLIHRTVIEGMQEFIGNKWFKCDDPLAGGGEDRRFFEYAKLAGFPAYVDRSCIVGHVAGDIATSSADFIAWDSVSKFENTGQPEVKDL